MNRPPMELSNSRMVALACPWSYWQRVLRGFYAPGGIAAERGQIFHEVPALYIPELSRLNRKRDYDIFCDCVAKVCDGKPDWMILPLGETFNKFFRGFLLDKKAISHMVEFTIAVNRKGEPVVVHRDERGECIGLTEDVITGRLDYRYIKKNYRESWVMDWKSGIAATNWNAPSHDPQGILYAALDFWIDPRREYVHMCRWGVAGGENGKSVYTWSREAATSLASARIEQSFDKLDAMWPLIELGGQLPVLPNSPGTCQYCPVANRCPLNQADLAVLMAQPPLTIPRRTKVA